MTPVDASGGPVLVRLTVARAEALTDAVPGDLADDWPEDWPDHAQAFTAALQAVDDALNGEAEDVDCLRCLGYAVDVADHALHAALIRAARAADCIVIGSTLHAVDGCHVARGAHPAVVEVGGYRGRRIPVFVRAADADRWLSARTKRKACKLCRVATTRARPYRRNRSARSRLATQTQTAHGRAER